MLVAAFATRAHRWVVVNLFSTWTLSSSSAKLLSVRSLSWCTGYSSPGEGLHVSLSWTSRHPFLSISPSCWGPSEWQHTRLVNQLLSPVLYHLLVCWEQGSVPSSRSLMKMWNIDAKNTPLMMSLRPAVCLRSVHLTARLFRSYFITLSMMMLWETVSKTFLKQV